MKIENQKILYVDKRNSNGRIYSKQTVQEIIDQINTGNVVGQIGIGATQGVNISNVSHTVTNARIEGEYVVADIKILPTPAGMDLEGLKSINSSEINFAPRGAGIVDENGIVSDYRLISIDAVMEPVSHLHSFEEEKLKEK